jgi:hypothetical protein
MPRFEEGGKIWKVQRALIAISLFAAVKLAAGES